MSRRQEIIRRANEEYSAALSRGAALRKELLRQRQAALAAVPAAKAALRRHDAAMAAAYDAYASKLRELAEETETATAGAQEAQAEAELAATEKWRDSVSGAEEGRRAAQAAAASDYDEAYATAAGATGTTRDSRLAAARNQRDAAVRAADRNYRRDLDTAWASYQRASTAAREKAIAVVDRARQKQAAAEAKAAEILRRAQEAARLSLTAALDQDPESAAIADSFESRLEQAEARMEHEKADVLARLKRDLANARG